jgi:hypothetical protein
MMKALALLVLLIPVEAAADCALLGLVPKVLTAPDAVLAPDGGIVVGAVSEDRGPLDDGDIAVQPAWKFVVARGTITPAIDTLAPGLAVYRASYETLELHDDKGTVLAKHDKIADKRDKLPAPKVKSIKYDAPMSRRNVVRIEVTIDGAKPEGVIALGLADAKGAAKSWGQTTGTGTVFYPYSQRDCLALPNGTKPSKKGDKVTLFWIDGSGRKSAFTKPLTIQ